ncbi:hypothetical protein ACVWZZ_002129 [Bradyrhizobium sp. LM6.10]
MPAGTHGPLRESVAQGNRTAAYRCSQITRPSLRSGFTAYAVLSREPSSCWPPSPSRKSRTPRRLTRMPPPQRLDRSNDGQDHTVLPYARLACRHRFRRRCARCRRPDDETNLTAPLIQRETSGSRRAIRPARTFAPDAVASTASPALRPSRHMVAPQGVSRDGRHICQNRISVKRNIFVGRD